MAMERHDLPEVWEWRRLDDIAPIDTKPVWPNNEPDKLFRYIALENIESGTGNLTGFKPTKGAQIKSNKFRFDTHHVLLGKLRPYLNKVFVPNFEGICSTDILPLLPDPKVLLREFFAICLRSPYFIEYSKTKMEGAKMPRLRTPDLENYKIPIPPLLEQRRIVKRIEKLTQRVEETRRIRTATIEEAEKYIPAVIARAFESFQKKVELVKIGNKNYFELIMGQSPPSSSYNTYGKGLPFFQGKAEFGKIYPIAKKYCNKPSRIAIKDDVLISVRAPVGPTNLSDQNCCIGRGLAAIRCTKRVNPYFLLLALRNIENTITASVQDQGGGFTAIKREQLENIEIPIPPLEEQKRIVDYLNSLQSKTEKLRQLQIETEAELSAFTPALLAKAFRGEL